MPKPQWAAIVNLMVCGLLAFSAHFQWSAALALERHTTQIGALEKRVDKLEL